MANYLQRVASSAGRRAAIAKPPVSGPPVLPAGRDFSLASADPFAIDEEQSVQSSATGRPARTEERADTPSAAKATQPETLAAPLEPRPRPRPAQEQLSSESPFTVQVPRTLRPSATPNVSPTTSNEPHHERSRVRASTTLRPEEFAIGEQPAPILRSTDSFANESTSVTAAPDTTASMPQPGPSVADRDEKLQAPKQVHTEATRYDTTPIPRVDRVDGLAKFPVHSAEPAPPPATPIHLPPAISTARQEPSHIHIGSLEVLVNNHPRVTAARPAPAPSRTERLNLEKRYLDRFRLRH